MLKLTNALRVTFGALLVTHALAASDAPSAPPMSQSQESPSASRFQTPRGVDAPRNPRITPFAPEQPHCNTRGGVDAPAAPQTHDLQNPLVGLDIANIEGCSYDLEEKQHEVTQNHRHDQSKTPAAQPRSNDETLRTENQRLKADMALLETHKINADDHIETLRADSAQLKAQMVALEDHVAHVKAHAKNRAAQMKALDAERKERMIKLEDELRQLRTQLQQGDRNNRDIIHASLETHNAELQKRVALADKTIGDLQSENTALRFQCTDLERQGRQNGILDRRNRRLEREYDTLKTQTHITISKLRRENEELVNENTALKVENTHLSRVSDRKDRIINRLRQEKDALENQSKVLELKIQEKAEIIQGLTS